MNAAPIAGFPGIEGTNFVSITNPTGTLQLQVGITAAISGSFNLFTTPTNPTAPNDYILSTANAQGTSLFVRVDAGGVGKSQGFDFRFGDLTATPSIWISKPRLVGRRIEAAWETGSVLIETLGGKFTLLNPMIRINMVASFIHDTVRFQFTEVNLDSGPHNVGLAFTEDISQPSTILGTTLGTGYPIRLPANTTLPYLRTETLLQTVPAYYEIFAPLAAATATTPALYHSIRGTLIDTQANFPGVEPTPPTRVAFGRVSVLDGTAPPFSAPGVFTPGVLWNFTPDPSVNLIGASALPSAVTVFWDPSQLVPQNPTTYVTFVGQSTTDNDFNLPVSLDVSSPPAFNYSVDRTDPLNPVCSSTTPITITAYGTNRTDLDPRAVLGTGQAVTNVKFTLTLPQGLILANPVQTPLSQTVASIAPGNEGSVSWQVIVNPQQPGGLRQAGNLKFIVTESDDSGGSKNVQRAIQVPSPPNFTLPGQTTTQGQFVMFSIPYDLGGTPLSKILGPAFAINSGITPLFDLVGYIPGPVNAHYEEKTTTVQGRGYFVRSKLPGDQTVKVDCATYLPIAGQVQTPGQLQTFKLIYPAGWNLIANPYLYNIRFSEVTVGDTNADSLDPYNPFPATVAADTIHRLIAQQVWYYDTSDTNPANWQYIPLPLGFDMEPFKAYWLFFEKELTLHFPGVDTPGVSVSRAVKGAPTGLTLSTVGSSQNWTTHIYARTASGSGGTDSIYVGVSPKATDNYDMYKYLKPPAASSQISLSILHPEWRKGDVALDVRSSSFGQKIWNVRVVSARPHQDIDLSWPNIGANLPRSLRLRLLNPATGESKLLRSVSSYRVQTGADATAQLQIVADNEGHGRAVVTTFDIVPGITRGVSGQPAGIALHYVLTRAAQIQLTISNSNGQFVRTLTQPSAAIDSNGTTGDLVWDGHDQQGKPLHRGTYRIELHALTSDGEHTRIVKTYTVH